MLDPPKYGCRMRAFHHLALQVVDLPKLEAFYRELFELPVLQRWPDGQGGERSVWLGLHDGFIALEKAPPGTALPPRGEFGDARAGFYVFALRIEKAERAAWEARLQKAGVAIERRTAYSLFFRDPEGNRLAVSHHPHGVE